MWAFIDIIAAGNPIPDLTSLGSENFEIDSELGYLSYICYILDTPPLPPEGKAPEGTRRASLALNSRYYECAPKGTVP